MATIQELEEQYIGTPTAKETVSIDTLEKKYGVSQPTTTSTIDELEQEYSIRPLTREKFDPEGSGYDMKSALAAGMKANSKGKWESREARSGLLLKGRKHISWPDTVAGEKEAGYTIYKKNGRYYSKGQEKPSGAGGSFEKPWDERLALSHPNLYAGIGAATETAKESTKFGHLKYLYPEEREKLTQLPPQQQTRQLLTDTLEDVGGLAAGPIMKGVGQVAKKVMPSAYKAFTTPIGKPRIKAFVEGGRVKLTSAQTTPEVATDPNTELYDKIITAIRGRKSLRGKQEQLYKIDRAERFGKVAIAGKQVPGEAGYHAQLGKLKGPMTEVEFKSIRDRFGQVEVDELFNIIERSSKVPRVDHKVTAKRGMANLLGEKGGKLPTEGELKFLSQIFPKNLIDTLKKSQPLWNRMKEGGLQLANIPRSIMSSFDLSAPFRQGLFLIPTNPKGFFQAFKKMFKQFGSEKAYKAVQESITRTPTYELAQESGLSLTELGSTMLKREEKFQSQWAEKIPFLVGRGVKASGRAYTGFLNKQRMDAFEYLINKAERLGRDPKNNMDLTKQIAGFVNIASGRGGLGALENSAVALNATLFSPRLIASRLQLLNPVYYIKADPYVRKEALKSLFAVTGAVGTVLGLAKAGGADVGLDPRSADFLKLKIGDTRIDMLGGVQQYMRVAGQLITGKYVSSTTGKVMTLGEGYRPLTRWEIALRFGESKLAPVASFAMTLLKGQDFEGKKIRVPKEIGKRFVPMVTQDVYDLAKEDPELLPVSLLGVFGVGLQTYKPKSRLKGGIKGIGKISD